MNLALLRLTALLALAALLLAGCGGSDDSKSTDDAKASSSESSDDSADEDEEEAEDEDSESEAAVEAGIAYEDAVLPHVAQLKPLIERMDTTSDKLIAGTIDVARGAEAFGKQEATALQLAAKVRAMDIEDEYLAEANEDLAKSIDSYALAMSEFSTFNDGMSEAQIETVFEKGNAHVDNMLTSLDAWGTALSEDPEGRPFTRTAAKLVEIGEYVENL